MQAFADYGPLASKKQFDRVADYFRLAAEEAGTVITGGPGEGWTFNPTIITDVSQGGRVWREEMFGPIATVATRHSTKPRTMISVTWPAG